MTKRRPNKAPGHGETALTGSADSGDQARGGRPAAASAAAGLGYAPAAALIMLGWCCGVGAGVVAGVVLGVETGLVACPAQKACLVDAVPSTPSRDGRAPAAPGSPVELERPKDGEFWNEVGQRAHAEGRLEEAVKALSLATHASGFGGTLWSNLGIAMADRAAELSRHGGAAAESAELLCEAIAATELSTFLGASDNHTRAGAAPSPRHPPLVPLVMHVVKKTLSWPKMGQF